MRPFRPNPPTPPSAPGRSPSHEHSWSAIVASALEEISKRCGVCGSAWMRGEVRRLRQVLKSIEHQADAVDRMDILRQLADLDAASQVNQTQITDLIERVEAVLAQCEGMPGGDGPLGRIGGPGRSASFNLFDTPPRRPAA
jgi:hypothetical protein